MTTPDLSSSSDISSTWQLPGTLSTCFMLPLHKVHLLERQECFTLQHKTCGSHAKHVPYGNHHVPNSHTGQEIRFIYIHKRISSAPICSPPSLSNTTTQVVQTTTRSHSNASSKPLGQTLHIEVKPIHPICCILAASQCFPETELQPLFYTDCFLHLAIRRSAAIPASLTMPQRRAQVSGTIAIIRRQLERALSPSPAAPC